jgi:hypothetical protein
MRLAGTMTCGERGETTPGHDAQQEDSRGQLEDSHGQLEDSRGQLEGSHGQLEDSRGQLEGSHGQRPRTAGSRATNLMRRNN